MTVDHCIIEYKPQCPINSTGRVRVYVYDTRLQGQIKNKPNTYFQSTVQLS
ncbi:hypothetical protein RHMOL_Rhmol02G0188600 [Rhododendron molle]|uniref:Uncharacterized protein n=1 Tax=Rhododendron molle TaxID=49168 RepID=A0ACC0PRE6_RHOML|nr:hypothetical protein RHMOL_Rhmol02G0188600 [Rhododendron molle]